MILSQTYPDPDVEFAFEDEQRSLNVFLDDEGVVTNFEGMMLALFLGGAGLGFFDVAFLQGPLRGILLFLNRVLGGVLFLQ